MEITYVNGDATNPMSKGNKIIAHVCNDLGKWGKGFVMAISKKWPEPRAEYLKWYGSKSDFKLGNIQVVKVTTVISVCNMVAQKGIKIGSKGAPIRYEALQECLQKLAIVAKETEASVHMPRIGTGLAGGKWESIEPLVKKELVYKEISVYIYER